MSALEKFIFLRLAKYLGTMQQTEQVAFMTKVFGHSGLEMLSDIREMHPKCF
jgi:hypothetical protein